MDEKYNVDIKFTSIGGETFQSWLHDYIREEVLKLLNPAPRKPRIAVHPGYLVIAPAGADVEYRWRRGLRWLPKWLLRPFFVHPFSRHLCETVITEHG